MPSTGRKRSRLGSIAYGVGQGVLEAAGIAQPYRFVKGRWPKAPPPRRSALLTLGEKKFKDTSIVESPSNALTRVYLLNGIEQGTGAENRVGAKTTIHSLLMRGTFTSGSRDDFVRVAIIWDKSPNGISSLPDITSFFDVNSNIHVNSFNNLNNRRRYKVLYDEVVAIGGTDGANNKNGSPTIYATRAYRKLRLSTIYTGSEDTLSDISEGALYAVILNMYDTGDTGAETTLNFRIRYTDN